MAIESDSISTVIFHFLHHNSSSFYYLPASSETWTIRKNSKWQASNSSIFNNIIVWYLLSVQWLIITIVSRQCWWWRRNIGIKGISLYSSFCSLILCSDFQNDDILMLHRVLRYQMKYKWLHWKWSQHTWDKQLRRYWGYR